MLKSVAVVSELLLYLVPVILFLWDFYSIYKIKKRMQDQYYTTLYALPFIMLVLSFKGLLIFRDLSSSIFLYIIDLGLSLFIMIFIAMLVKYIIRVTHTRQIKFHWQDFAIPAGTLIVPLINHKFANWFDFLTYCFIGGGVLFVSIFFAKLDVYLRKYMFFNIILSYINVAAFALFGPGFVDSYAGAIYLSVSGLAIVIVAIREAHIFVLQNLGELKVLEAVYHWHLKTMLRALVVAIAISALSVTTVAASTVYVVTVHNKAQSDLLKSVFQESNAVTDNSRNILINLGSAVKLVSLKISSPDNSSEVEKAMSSVFSLYRDSFYYFDMVNDKGTVIAVYPKNSSVDNFALNNSYAERIFLTHSPTVSHPLTTKHGFHTFFICYPVFSGKRFAGFVEGAVNINIFKRAFVNLGEEKISFNIKTAIYENGIVLDGTGDIPSFSGITDFYDYLLKSTDLFYKNTLFKFLNGRFGVISYAPQKALISYVNNVIRQTGIALFLILLALLYIMYLVISMLRSVDLHLGKAVEHAIKREKKAKRSAIDISKRLMKLTAFFNAVSFDQPDEIFYYNLLDVAIKVIPSAQKGSIAIKKGNYLYFVASHGFSLDRLKQVRLPVEKQKLFMRNKITVINEIRKIDKKVYSDKELKDIADAGHLSDIESTLSAAIYSEGQYVGSIFIDNMERENAFTTDDIKISEAISNAASMFVQGKHYINRIKQTLKADAIVLSLMEKLKNRKSSDSVILQVFRSLHDNISADIIGVGAVIHSVTGFLKLCATEKIHSEMPIEELKVNTTEPVFVNPDNLEDALWTNKMKSIYFVPDKKLMNEGICIGFSKPKEEISKELLELLNVLLPSVHDLISNAELSKELSRVYIELLISMIHSIELKDPYTRNHSERVTVFAYLLGKRYGLPMRQLRTLYYAAMLHDIGKVGIPDEILKKQGSLTEDEFKVIKQHPQIGANMIMDVTFLKESAYIILFHHEHYDGSGYLAHLKGDQIPLLSRIITIVDAFDAIITERPYKGAYTIDEAIEYLRKGRGTHFDPKLTDMFIEMLETEREKFEEIIRKPDVMSIYEELFEL